MLELVLSRIRAMLRLPIGRNSIAERSMIEPYDLIDNLFKVTLAQWRVYEYVMSGVYVKGGLEEGKFYELDLEAYCRYFNLEYHSTYVQLKKSFRLKELVGPTFEFSMEDLGLESTSEEKCRYVPLVNAFEYSKGSKYIGIRFSPEIVTMFNKVSFKEGYYSKYLLKNTRYLESINSVMLFRLVNKWKKLGQGAYSLEDFKRKIGIGEEQYAQWNDLEKKVLLSAIEEINSKTNLTITIEPLKGGRKVIGVNFKIARKHERIT